MKEPDPPKPKLPDPVELSHAVASIAERSQRIVSEFLARQKHAEISPDPLNVANAFLEMTAKLMADPGRLMEAQVSLWGDYMRLWQRTASRFLGGDAVAPVIAPASGDRRFRDAAWQDNAVFDFIKQSYLLTARFVGEATGGVDGMADKDARKVDFYTRQFVDAVAPSNFVLTNPEVLRATVESGGENLIKGLEHLLDDLERGKGRLAIKMTDGDQFELGRNIATTPGMVIFQNDLMQLIQYQPATETVFRRPLLIVPPWINKFYILDLRPKNSFIRWAVAEGHSVFVISWVNPDRALAGKSFDDYMVEGPLAALDAIEAATGEVDVNAIGYCIGGTLLAATLAYMAARGDQRIASVTYLTTLVDFSEVGELSVFIDEEQIAALEAKMAEPGVLDGADMAATFNMLRANDLIWSFVVNNYLLGKEPFPFDLLYWNSDATALPATMHGFYLRNMYQQNLLIRPGAITLAGVPIDLSRIAVPSFILATKEDHIVPWRSSYQGGRIYQGPVTFCLAGSGHVAGVINPPDAGKYAHWTSRKLPDDPDDWLAGAKRKEGSWWTSWNAWVRKFGRGRIAPRQPENDGLTPIEAAPGSYVRKRANT